MHHLRRQSISCQKLRAFTLTELLVVVAIIGVLAALVFSGIGKMRENSRSARCLSNLRQQGLAITAYAADNKGCGYPVYRDSQGPHWGAQIHVLVAGGYVTETGGDSLTDPVASTDSIFSCPSGEDDAPAFGGSMIGKQGTGPADPELQRPGRWLPDPPVQGGIHGAKLHYDSWYSWNADNVDSAALPLSAGRRINTISRPTRTIFAMDGPFALHIGYTRVSARHGSDRNLINVLFADTHVETVRIDALFDPATKNKTAAYLWTVN